MVQLQLKKPASFLEILNLIIISRTQSIWWIARIKSTDISENFDWYQFKKE